MSEGARGILVMLFAPKGLWGLVSERYDLTLFPTRRRLLYREYPDQSGRHGGRGTGAVSGDEGEGAKPGDLVACCPPRARKLKRFRQVWS